MASNNQPTPSAPLPSRWSNGNKKNSKEQKQRLVLSQVMDMFGSIVDPEIIQVVVQNCKWKLQPSVDALMMLSEDVETSASPPNPSYPDPTAAPLNLMEKNVNKIGQPKRQNIKQDVDITFLGLNDVELSQQQEEFRKFELLKKELAEKGFNSANENVSNLNYSPNSKVSQPKLQQFTQSWNNALGNAKPDPSRIFLCSDVESNVNPGGNARQTEAANRADGFEADQNSFHNLFGSKLQFSRGSTDKFYNQGTIPKNCKVQPSSSPQRQGSDHENPTSHPKDSNSQNLQAFLNEFMHNEMATKSFECNQYNSNAWSAKQSNEEVDRNPRNSSQQVAQFDSDHENQSQSSSKLNLNKSETESLCGLKVQYRRPGLESSSDDDADVVIEEESECSAPIPPLMSVNVCQFLSSSTQSPPTNTYPDSGTLSTPSPPSSPERSNYDATFRRIMSSIADGHKVLIIMRGLPGSGKSHLSKSIARSSGCGNPVQFVISADDYFYMLGRGSYAWTPSKLGDAHAWAENKAEAAMKKGLSPVIIDNTNIRIHDMRPYFVMGIRHGYLIEVLEPNTPWNFNVNELARKNNHGVPKDSIRRILERYEPYLSAATLMEKLSLRYSPDNMPPQMRKLPPLRLPNAEGESVPGNQESPKAEKPKRNRSKRSKKNVCIPSDAEFPDDSCQPETETSPDPVSVDTLTKENATLNQSLVDYCIDTDSGEEMDDKTCSKVGKNESRPTFDLLGDVNTHDDGPALVESDTIFREDASVERELSDGNNQQSSSSASAGKITPNSVQSLGAIGSERRGSLSLDRNGAANYLHSKNAGHVLSQCWDFTIVLNGEEIHSVGPDVPPIATESENTAAEKEDYFKPSTVHTFDHDYSTEIYHTDQSPLAKTRPMAKESPKKVVDQTEVIDELEVLVAVVNETSQPMGESTKDIDSTRGIDAEDSSNSAVDALTDDPEGIITSIINKMDELEMDAREVAPSSESCAETCLDVEAKSPEAEEMEERVVEEDTIKESEKLTEERSSIGSIFSMIKKSLLGFSDAKQVPSSRDERVLADELDEDVPTIPTEREERTEDLRSEPKSAPEAEDWIVSATTDEYVSKTNVETVGDTLSDKLSLQYDEDRNTLLCAISNSMVHDYSEIGTDHPEVIDTLTHKFSTNENKNPDSIEGFVSKLASQRHTETRICSSGTNRNDQTRADIVDNVDPLVSAVTKLAHDLELRNANVASNSDDESGKRMVNLDSLSPEIVDSPHGSSKNVEEAGLIESWIKIPYDAARKTTRDEQSEHVEGHENQESPKTVEKDIEIEKTLETLIKSEDASMTLNDDMFSEVIKRLISLDDLSTDGVPGTELSDQCPNAVSDNFEENDAQSDDHPTDEGAEIATDSAESQREIDAKTSIKTSNEIIDNVNQITWKESPFPVAEQVATLEIGSVREVAKGNVSTNTSDYDFNVAYFDGVPEPGVRYLIGRNKSINDGTVSTVDPQPPRKLMLDKSSMTGVIDILSSEGKQGVRSETDTMKDLDDLIHMFPNVPQEDVTEIYKHLCKCDFDWTLEVLLDGVPENIPRYEKIESPKILLDAGTSAGGAKSGDEGGSQARESPLHQDRLEKLKQSGSSEASNGDSRNRSHGPSPKRKKDKHRLSEIGLELKRQIEEKMVMSEESYHPHILRVKRWKNGEPDLVPPTETEPIGPAATSSEYSLEAEEVSPKTSESTDDFGEDYVESEETMELNLGRDFIKVLENEFGSPDFDIPVGLFPVIQIKKTLAQQLHTLWIESMEQQLNAQQEQLDKMLESDAAFARSLEEEQARSVTEPVVPNLQEIMDMEMALAIYNNDMKRLWKQDSPTDMASHLTRKMLHEMFPHNDPETLDEILNAHNGHFQETVEVLEASTGETLNRNKTLEKQKKLIDRVEKESMESTKRSTRTESSPIIVVNPDLSYSGNTIPQPMTYDATMEEANTAREEAQWHLSKRNENFNKATEAFRNGKRDVAGYYSQMAKLHTKKMEHANAAAASAFLAAQYYVMNKENTLDLHYLYVAEAMQALDVFLDYQIARLNDGNKKTMNLYIITGRGARSSRGLSRIKPAVSRKLASKNIRFVDENPGCLKVIIHRTNYPLSS